MQMGQLVALSPTDLRLSLNLHFSYSNDLYSARGLPNPWRCWKLFARKLPCFVPVYMPACWLLYAELLCHFLYVRNWPRR